MGNIKMIGAYLEQIAYMKGERRAIEMSEAKEGKAKP